VKIDWTGLAAPGLKTGGAALACSFAAVSIAVRTAIHVAAGPVSIVSSLPYANVRQARVAGSVRAPGSVSQEKAAQAIRHACAAS